jgi:hypothetical protein
MTTIASSSVLKPQSGAIGPKVYSLLAHVKERNNNWLPSIAAVPQGLSLGSQPHAADDEPWSRCPPVHRRRPASGLGIGGAPRSGVSTHRAIRTLTNGQISCYETHNRFDDTLTTGLDGLFSYAA